LFVFFVTQDASVPICIDVWFAARLDEAEILLDISSYFR